MNYKILTKDYDNNDDEGYVYDDRNSLMHNVIFVVKYPMTCVCL